MTSMGEGIWPFSNRNSAIWPWVFIKDSRFSKKLVFFQKTTIFLGDFTTDADEHADLFQAAEIFWKLFGGIYSDEKNNVSISRHVKWVNCFPQDYTYIYIELELSKVIKNTIEPCSKCAQVLFPHIICSPHAELPYKGPLPKLSNVAQLKNIESLWKTYSWLVVSTPLKNISQLGLLFPIYGKNNEK